MPRQILPVAIALAVGLIVVLGSLFRLPYFDQAAGVLVPFGATLAGIAILLGLWNVITVHVQRLLRPGRDSIFSAVILVAASVTLVITLPAGPNGVDTRWIFENVYRPLEASFIALLAFLVATAAYRSLRARSIETTLMLLTAIIILIGQIPFGAFLAPLKEWILNVPVVAGTRGILLGVALGAMATALRLLFGIDRPYAE